MAFWFVGHHIPAKGPYFGFAEAASAQTSAVLNASPLNTFALNQGPKIVGFNQGTFFSGGRSPELLKKIFEVGVGPAPIEEVAAMFDGLWEVRHPAPVAPPIAGAVTDEMVVAALDDLAAKVQERTQQHGGIGHNGPPGGEASLTTDDRMTILRATHDAKMAVLSKDKPGIQEALDILMPLVVKLGNGIVTQLNNMVSKFTGTLGVAGAVLVIDWVGDEIGLWNKAHIAAWLLTHLAKGIGSD